MPSIWRLQGSYSALVILYAYKFWIYSNMEIWTASFYGWVRGGKTLTFAFFISFSVMNSVEKCHLHVLQWNFNGMKLPKCVTVYLIEKKRFFLDDNSFTLFELFWRQSMHRHDLWHFCSSNYKILGIFVNERKWNFLLKHFMIWNKLSQWPSGHWYMWWVDNARHCSVILRSHNRNDVNPYIIFHMNKKPFWENIIIYILCSIC